MILKIHYKNEKFINQSIRRESLDSETQRKIDEIMYETNDKVSAIVNEMRQIRFSQLAEQDKQRKSDELRRQFEEVMIQEEKRIEEILKDN